MRFNIRLLGRTDSGQRCQADVSVYARSQRGLQEQARKAAETAVWLARDPPHEAIPEGSSIIVEHVKRL